MVLWIAMAALAAAACFPLLAALTRAAKLRPRSDPAMAIYRDQLDEVERDLARGVVVAGEAEAARTEIAVPHRAADQAAGHRATKGAGVRSVTEAAGQRQTHDCRHRQQADAVH
jgi:cytochrome c-type biogenesis protein CcmH